MTANDVALEVILKYAKTQTVTLREGNLKLRVEMGHYAVGAEYLPTADVILKLMKDGKKLIENCYLRKRPLPGSRYEFLLGRKNERRV